ncbi:hypothetical protein ABIB40_002470 [Pedobacter sp. UYP30]
MGCNTGVDKILEVKATDHKSRQEDLTKSTNKKTALN